MGPRGKTWKKNMEGVKGQLTAWKALKQDYVYCTLKQSWQGDKRQVKLRAEQTNKKEQN